MAKKVQFTEYYSIFPILFEVFGLKRRKVLCGDPNETLEAEVTVVDVLDRLYSNFALVYYNFGGYPAD